jgi:hypothetical protein
VRHLVKENEKDRQNCEIERLRKCAKERLREIEKVQKKYRLLQRMEKCEATS